MSISISDRIARTAPERPVEQIRATENRRAEAADARQQASQASQENRVNASRQEDKGRYVDRYA